MNRYLQERKGRWYFRIRVPKMLQPHLNTEISYPIWGIDINTANARCMVLGERLKQVFCLNASDWNMFGKLRVATSEELKRFPRESLCSQYETSVGVTFDGILFAKRKWGEFQK